MPKNKKRKTSLTDSVDEELHESQVKKRAVRGVVSLFARQGIKRVLGFVGLLVLARILTPEMFGIFAIAHFVILFFEEVSNMGLSAALLRKKDNVIEAELRTVFTLQQAVVLVSLVLIFVFAPDIVRLYELGPEFIWLFQVFGIALLLASLKTIPVVLLQRQLRHDLVALSEVTEHIVYLALAIALAYHGYGVWSLVIATLCRGLVGLLILYRMAWWTPRLGFDRQIARTALGFGIPIQLAGMARLANNAVVPVVIGTLLGTAAVGIVNFARTLLDSVAFQPLNLMGKVQLRLFSRIQDEPEKLVRLLNKSLFVGSALTLYMIAILVAIVPVFIDVVVTSKWAPALPVIYVLSIGYVAYAISLPYQQALKAMGDSMTPLVIALSRFGIQILLVTYLVSDYDVTGFAIALVVALFATLPYVVFKVHRRVKPSIMANIWGQIVAAAMCYLASSIVIEVYQGVPGMFLAVLAGTVIYYLVLGIFKGERLAGEIETTLIQLAPESARMKRLIGTICGYTRRLQFDVAR